MFGSFQIRLVIAFVALFAAVSVTVSFAGLVLREQQVRAMFDRDLALRAEIVLDNIRREPTIDNQVLTKAVLELSDTMYFRDLYVQIFNDKSEIIAKTSNMGDAAFKLRVPFEDRSIDQQIVDGIKNYDMPEGKVRPRGMRIRFDGTDGDQYIAIVSANPAYMTASIRATRWLFFGGNMGGLAAAGAAAWFVTGAMSGRIRALVEQIKLVGPESLDLRIQLPDRDEITEIAGHINAALDRLKAGFDTQERFIHDASHELKTPIATVQAEAQAMLLGQPSEAELLDFTRSMNDEMRRLGSLTEALLLLTRIDETALLSRFKPVDLVQTTTDAVQHLSAMACDYQVRVSLHTGENADHASFVQGDPQLLESMISNLIRNAIRFSPRGKEVRVTLQNNSDSIQLSVEDEGPGIPEDILPRIFDRYFESSTQRVRRGAGLGLAIARTVADIHGGAVSAANSPLGGAKLVVKLPCSSDK